MATMKVLFKAVDEISAKFDSMTRSGERALESFESAGTAADGSLGRASATATSTARSLETAADATDNPSAAASETSESSAEPQMQQPKRRMRLETTATNPKRPGKRVRSSGRNPATG